MAKMNITGYLLQGIRMRENKITKNVFKKCEEDLKLKEIDPLRSDFYGN